MVRVRTLQRAALPSELLHHVSPASSHSRRVATNVAENGEDCTIYIASGVHVYGIKIELRETTVEAGKEDMLIPVDGQVADAWQLQQCPHRAEIQSIALSASQNDGGVLLGSVDSNGHLVVTCLDSTTSRGASYTAGPQDAGMGEGWWAGIVFSQSHLGLAAVARGMAKTIDFYDKDIHVRTLRTLQHPTSLTFLYGSGSSDNPPLLAVTEGPQVSIWDIRQGERGGCVHRLFGTSSGEPLYAISSSSDGLVATGGAERSIVVYDAYKWTARSRWTNCLKFEINGLFFSSADPGLIYVHGIDYEVGYLTSMSFLVKWSWKSPGVTTVCDALCFVDHGIEKAAKKALKAPSHSEVTHAGLELIKSHSGRNIAWSWACELAQSLPKTLYDGPRGWLGNEELRAVLCDIYHAMPLIESKVH